MRTPAQHHQAGIAWVKMQERQRKMNSIRRGLCPKCYGSGRGLILMKRHCSWCKGSGTSWLFFQCPACRGTGRTSRI